MPPSTSFGRHAQMSGASRRYPLPTAVAALARLDKIDAAAFGPDLKLLDCGGTEGVGGAEQDGFILRAEVGGELA